MKTKSNYFLIVETKGYTYQGDIPHAEQRKIAYAEKFFAHLQQHVGDMVDIRFTKRINAQSLGEVLEHITE